MDSYSKIAAEGFYSGKYDDFAPIESEMRFEDVYYTKKVAIQPTKKQQRFIEEQLRMLNELKPLVVKLLFKELSNMIAKAKESPKGFDGIMLNKSIRAGRKQPFTAIYKSIYDEVHSNKEAYNIEGIHHAALKGLIYDMVNAVANRICAERRFVKFSKLPYYRDYKNPSPLPTVFSFKLDEGKKQYRESGYDDTSSSRLHLRLQVLGWTRICLHRKKNGVHPYFTKEDWMQMRTIRIKKEFNRYYLIFGFCVKGENIKDIRSVQPQSHPRQLVAKKNGIYTAASILQRHSQKFFHDFPDQLRSFTEADLRRIASPGYDRIVNFSKAISSIMIDQDGYVDVTQGQYALQQARIISYPITGTPERTAELENVFGIGTFDVRFSPALLKKIDQFRYAEHRFAKQMHWLKCKFKMTDEELQKEKKWVKFNRLSTLYQNPNIQKFVRREFRYQIKIANYMNAIADNFVSEVVADLPMFIVLCVIPFRSKANPVYNPENWAEIRRANREQAYDRFTQMMIDTVRYKLWNKARLLQIGIYNTSDTITEEMQLYLKRIREQRISWTEMPESKFRQVGAFLSKKKRAAHYPANITEEDMLKAKPLSLCNQHLLCILSNQFNEEDRLIVHGIDQSKRYRWYPVNGTLFNSPMKPEEFDKPYPAYASEIDKYYAYRISNPYNSLMANQSDDFSTKMLLINSKEIDAHKKNIAKHAARKNDRKSW